MSNELVLQQEIEKETTIPNIETEIECPRCYDIMVLYSDFDRICRHPLNYATGVSLWPLTKEDRERERGGSSMIYD
jgi:hypothetical protein